LALGVFSRMKISSNISTIAPATKPLNAVDVRVRGGMAWTGGDSLAGGEGADSATAG
jgi:phage baseplate assembly protein gpV